jgi:hypothetical protein
VVGGCDRDEGKVGLVGQRKLVGLNQLVDIGLVGVGYYSTPRV